MYNFGLVSAESESESENESVVSQENRHQPTEIPPNKPLQMDSGASTDFSLLVRTKVAKEHKDDETVVGLEVRVCE